MTDSFFFFFNDTATTEIYTLSLHDALPICAGHGPVSGGAGVRGGALAAAERRGALAGRAAGELAPHRVVARLVPVGVCLAVARLLPERPLARRFRPGGGRLRHQCAAAGERGRTGRPRLWRPANPQPRRHPAHRSVGSRGGAARAFLDPGRRGAGIGGRGTGGDTAGREVARERSEEHTSELQSPCNLVC